MNWMSVIRNIPTSWRKKMKTSITVISSDMNPPNYSLSHMSARSMYTKLIQPPSSQKTTEKLLNNYEVNWRQSYLIPQNIPQNFSVQNFEQYFVLQWTLIQNRSNG